MQFLLGFIAAIVLLCSPAVASAESQRMGIAPGAFDIAPSSSSNVAAFCFDLTRDSPNASTDYSNVLTSTNEATVKIGNQTMPIQQAIQQHLIAVKGLQPSFNDLMVAMNDPGYLNHLSKARRQEIMGDIATWNQASPADKQQMEQEFSTMAAQIGNHTQLQIVNLTNQTVHVNVAQPVVFGQNSDVGLPLDLPSLASGVPHASAQDAVWKLNTKAQQGELIHSGFLPPGGDDGNYGDTTTFAVALFQSAENLPVTGNIDSATAKALLDDNRELVRLDQYNSEHVAFGYLFGTIERMNDPSAPVSAPSYLYRISFGDNDNYIAQSPRDAAQWLESQLKGSGIMQVDLQPVGFERDRLEAFSTSIDIASKLSPIDVSLIHDGLQNDLFRVQPKSLIDDGTPPVEGLIHGVPGYKKTISITGADGTAVVLSFVSTSSDFISNLIDNLKELLQKIGLLQTGQSIGPLNSNSNLADIVQVTVGITQQQNGWTDQEVKNNFQVQLNDTTFAAITRALNLIMKHV